MTDPIHLAVEDRWIEKHVIVTCPAHCAGILCGPARLPRTLCIVSTGLCRSRVFIACNTKGPKEVSDQIVH